MNKFDDVCVLIVDEHANMRILWRTIFIGFGVRTVFEASDVMTAIDLLKTDPIDIVIVDHSLSDLSGAEMTRMVRHSEDMPYHIPIIACTADTRRSILYELVNSGVDEILAKPVSALQAWSKMAAVVNQRRPFVRSSIYLGPDRRRKQMPYKGPDRRRKES